MLEVGGVADHILCERSPLPPSATLSILLAQPQIITALLPISSILIYYTKNWNGNTALSLLTLAQAGRVGPCSTNAAPTQTLLRQTLQGHWRLRLLLAEPKLEFPLC